MNTTGRVFFSLIFFILAFICGSIISEEFKKDLITAIIFFFIGIGCLYGAGSLIKGLIEKIS